MNQVGKHLQSLTDDEVAASAIDVNHKAHTAAVTLKAGVIQTLFVWQSLSPHAMSSVCKNQQAVG